MERKQKQDLTEAVKRKQSLTQDLTESVKRKQDLTEKQKPNQAVKKIVKHNQGLAEKQSLMDADNQKQDLTEKQEPDQRGSRPRSLRMSRS